MGAVPETSQAQRRRSRLPEHLEHRVAHGHALCGVLGRRLALVVPRLDVGARLDEQPHALGVTVGGGLRGNHASSKRPHQGGRHAED